MTEYAKTVFDSLYDCKMTVKGYTEQEIDGLTSMSESVLLEDIPCRISIVQRTGATIKLTAMI